MARTRISPTHTDDSKQTMDALDGWTTTRVLHSLLEKKNEEEKFIKNEQEEKSTFWRICSCTALRTHVNKVLAQNEVVRNYDMHDMYA